MTPPILDLKAVRGVVTDSNRAAENDRSEPLFLWNDERKQLEGTSIY